MKTRQYLFWALSFLIYTISAPLKAQYTLQSTDVSIVSNGIESCHVTDFNIAVYQNGHIAIPEKINGTSITRINSDRRNGVFENKGISAISLPGTLLQIGTRAFANNSISTLSIPDGVTVINPGAFLNNALDHVILPSTVEAIFQSAFEGNADLVSITLPMCGNAPGKYFSHWLDGSNQEHSGGSAVSDFTIAYEAQFVSSIPYTLTDADVTLNEDTIPPAIIQAEALILSFLTPCKTGKS